MIPKIFNNILSPARFMAFFVKKIGGNYAEGSLKAIE